jgi:hypothetical protein
MHPVLLGQDKHLLLRQLNILMVGAALAPPNRGAASSAPTSWVVIVKSVCCSFTFPPAPLGSRGSSPS